MSGARVSSTRRLQDHMQLAAFAEQSWRKIPKPGLNLASNEFVHPLIEKLCTAALQSATANRCSKYAVPQELADELARHFGLDPRQVIVTAGSDDAIRCLATAIFRSTSRLILQEPNYELVRKYAVLNNVAVHSVRMDPSSCQFALADMLAAVSRVAADGPGTAFISNPNGPVGSCYSLADVTTLAQHCGDLGFLLVIDEAYVPYNGFDHLALLREQPSVIIVRSFSKSFGTAGARVAMIACDLELADYLRRWYPMNPLSGFAIHLMRFLLEHEQEIIAARDEIMHTRSWFASTLTRAMPTWRPLPSAANFVSFDVGSAFTADAIANAMRQVDVHVRSMSSVQGLERCLRVTVADRATMRDVTRKLITIGRALSDPACVPDLWRYTTSRHRPPSPRRRVR